MTELEAQSVLETEFRVSRETMNKLGRFRELLLAENAHQNLIAASTEGQFWSRHILDSVQIIALSPKTAASWLDVGTGAGLPGLVLSLLTNVRHHLVEPRKLRADFVRTAIVALEVGDRVQLIVRKVEHVRSLPVDVITARAFASLDKTLLATRHLATSRSVWILSKGKQVKAELAEAQARWQADFVLVPSVTDPAASLVRVSGLRESRT